MRTETGKKRGGKYMSKSLILCDCAGTQNHRRGGPRIGDRPGLFAGALGPVHRQIKGGCKAMQEGDVVIACQQEPRSFEELAEEIWTPNPRLCRPARPGRLERR